MVESTKPLVLITGVTGYLGSQVLNEFINGEGAGRYRLRISVRDKDNQVKMKPLIDYFGDNLSSVEIYNADLTDANSIN